MLLVPLLVGTAILTVAVMSQVEAKERSDRPLRQVMIESKPPPSKSPLVDAFPHLRLWIPTDELIRMATEGRKAGRSGPDIVIRPPSETLTRAA